MRNLLDTAKEAGSFQKLTAAIEAAGLADTLEQKGPFTVFAPTDEAFAKLPPGALDELLKDKAKLGAVLTYHVLAGKVTSSEVAKLDHAKTLQGSDVTISTDGGVHVGKASVVKPDIEATNGIIHVIDEVILPK
jgi:uncharacterized surface protein with fasciclin (FAS1) repeats